MRWPSPYQAGGMTVREFCERHDLIRELTPFGHQDAQPWETVAALGDALDAAGETFRPRDLLDDPSAHEDATVRTGLLMLGAWPLESADGMASAWVSPHCADERSYAPGAWDSTEAAVRECASVATLRVRDVAPRLDYTKGSFTSWLSRNNVPWSEWRQEGRIRLGRTLKTSATWLTTRVSMLADPLPRSDTVSEWSVWHGTQADDWSVPDDPSRVGGFDW